MGLIEQITAVVLFAAFVLGVICGIAGGASFAFRSEDRHKSLNGEPPGLIAAGVRVLLGTAVLPDGIAPGGHRSLAPGSGGTHRKGADK